MGNAMSEKMIDTSGCYESLAEVDSSGEWVIRSVFIPHLEELSKVLEPKKNRRSDSGHTIGEWHVSPDFAWHPDSGFVEGEFVGKMLRRLEGRVDLVPYNRMKRLAVPFGLADALEAGHKVKRSAHRQEVQDRLLAELQKSLDEERDDEVRVLCGARASAVQASHKS